MNIKFKNRPTLELINNYCKKIEEFLSVHKLSVIIEISDIPTRIESYINNNLIGVENCWLEKCIISSQATGKIEIRLPREGIDETLSNRDIWDDAWSIQNQIYNYLKLKPDPTNSNDSYWNLWSYLEN